jgi:DNA (cytosine-5)-methyltransferase 1
MPAIHYPEPTPTGPRVTVSEALDDIANVDDDDYLRGSSSIWTKRRIALSAYAKAMRGGEFNRGYPRTVNPHVLQNSSRTAHRPETIASFAATMPGTREPISHFYRLTAEGLAPTLRAGSDRTRGRHTSPRPIHHIYDRCITVREMARLSGFPDWFRFDDRTWHGAREVGNAVPPPLARAIARQIYKSLPGTR